MKTPFSALKKFEALKNKLRIVKNDLDDDLNLIKHNFIKSKLYLKNLMHHKKVVLLTKKQMLQKYEEISNISSFKTDLYPFKDDAPMVSIIIINRNGLEHLKSLFKNFAENIQYPVYEVIVVDNASSDDSIKFLEQLSKKIILKIIKNTEKKSFSVASNHAASIAIGEYILLLNNELKPVYGWLNYMMHASLKSEYVGAVGAKLICFNHSISSDAKSSLRFYNKEIAFKEEMGLIKPHYFTKKESLEDIVHLTKEKAAISAETLLVEKAKYWQVNGLDEKYDQEYETVDFCLKLLKKGYKNIISSKAVLIHDVFEKKDRVINSNHLNNELFHHKWDPWLRKQLFKDKLNSSLIFSKSPLKIAFAVTECKDNAIAGDYFTAMELGESFKKLGWEISYLPRKGPGYWYSVEDIDVVISLLDSYNPKKIKTSKKSLVKIAWLRNWFERWVSNPGFSDYDIIFASSKSACDYVKHNTNNKCYLLPIATNINRFNDKITPKSEYKSDYCFTGSYWNDPRDIIDMLDPENLKYEFKLYGNNWDKINKFKNYYQGFIDYSKIPDIYASTKIVIDDANSATKDYGAVNSRVFDAIASGALVITNGEKGAKETFNGKLPFFTSKDELNSLIEYYLNNETNRKEKIKELKKFVLDNHTYKNRAIEIKKVLNDFFDH